MLNFGIEACTVCNPLRVHSSVARGGTPSPAAHALRPRPTDSLKKHPMPLSALTAVPATTAARTPHQPPRQARNVSRHVALSLMAACALGACGGQDGAAQPEAQPLASAARTQPVPALAAARVQTADTALNAHTTSPGSAAQAVAKADLPGGDAVCFYEHINYVGASFCASASSPWVGTVWNDRVSSVKVGSGQSVELFLDVNQTGRALQLGADEPDLRRANFNDLMSSFKVAPKQQPPTAAPASLGVRYAAGQSSFSLWSPDTANVQLNLNGTRYPMQKVADARGYTNVYAVVVPGDHHLKPYHFEVNGQASRDPYGVMVQPGTDNNLVLDLARTALPNGWAPLPPLAQRVDAVVYETHVRDFTVHPSSGLPAAQRGTYAGMTRAGGKVDGVATAKATGIDHLVDLGVTHVQLLPVYDFNSCSPAQVAANPSCYNWGYDPVNYNVPEERYSQTPNDPVARVREFKAMVDGFHRRGIRVVMDVVYNHTANKDVLGNITPRYYNAVDLSGTGNSLNAAEPMVARMVRDSLEHWVREYNIDGFRFDLMGVFDTEVVGQWGRHLNATFPGRNLLLYGEPWTGGVADAQEGRHLRYGSVGTLADAHVGVFNGAFRDALKNANNDSGGRGGFIFNQDTTDGGFGPFDASRRWPGGNLGLGALSLGLKGSPLANLPATQQSNPWTPQFTAAPEQTMNYADIHDNLCLADKVAAWAADNGQSANTGYLGRIQEFALSTVLTAQGIPVLHGGSEMQRSKGGVANSFESPDSVNALQWTLLNAHPEIHSYVRRLVALRRAHPAFRARTAADVQAHVQSDQRSASLVVTTINSGALGDAWRQTLLIHNAGGDQVVSLPPGDWRVAVEQSSASAGAERVVSGSVLATGTALTVLHQ